MSEEIFDVVDERDEVVGRNTRNEVHRLGLQHRAVHVLVFNSRGEIFLQKRSMQKDRQPGLWDSSASGHLNCGEDYDACAVRELGEELGPALRLDQGLRQTEGKIAAEDRVGCREDEVAQGGEGGFAVGGSAGKLGRRPAAQDA